MKKYICTLAILLMAFVFLIPASATAQELEPAPPYDEAELASPQSTVHTTTVSTSGGNRTVTWVQIDLTAGYEIRAMAAQDTFGRPSATLSQFADAVTPRPGPGSDTIVFPVNFFQPGANFTIVGALYSQGRVVSTGPEPWLNYGVGFTEDNRMSFFSGRISGNYIYGAEWYEGRLDYVTAFNIFPRLIINGQRVNVQPTPGFSAAMINNQVQRAFMGQRADGTFIVGVVNNTNIRQLQDIAEHFNLVNATNIDGGASAGIWRNGSVIHAPGRQLASVMVITREAGPPPPPPLPFTDVPANAWYRPYILAVYEADIMNGISPTRFEPYDTFSRAQVLTTLFRIHHGRLSIPSDPRVSGFTDVNAGWYAPYVTWAANNGITVTTSGAFHPNQAADRQTIALFIHRYVINMTNVNSDSAATPQWNAFTDRGQIADAGSYNALRWANNNDVVRGFDRGGAMQIAPQDTASRAEAATMLVRLMRLLP